MNINGLIGKISEPDFLSTISEQDYDLLFLSETCLSKNHHYNLSIKDYCCVHLFGNKSKTTKKGRYSGGISIYFKDKLSSKIHIEEKQQCGIMWVKLCKTLFSFKQDVFICHTYLPPKTSSLVKNTDLDIFELIENGIEKYKPLGKVLITGDLNSRTSDIPDQILFDKHLDNISNIAPVTYVSKRSNKDKTIDAFGKRLISLYKTSNFIIANGRLHKDANIGEFTFHNKNGSSTVDYLLLQAEDIEIIKEFQVQEPNEFSDHAALLFSISGLNKPQNVNFEVHIYILERRIY